MNNNIIPQNVTEILETNYMPYAMSVIISRAIPEVDGFKPAHRKLLYTMHKMGLINGNRIKSADVVGQTMRLNPHGDAAIYETLVRLTRGNAALLHPFIDSKGNFGKQYSKDMAYAASRYTEVKLDAICSELFKDIDKNAVDFVNNYNGTMQEPTLFPTTFPNVLVTPNQGIAVGMASSICSFNLKEVCKTTIEYIKNKNIDLLKYLKAPDFSTGGELIFNEKDILNVYETGRGNIKVRAKYRYDKKNSCIEVFEIPYTTTIEVIIDKIVMLVKNGKIREINDVRDETDLNGLKIAIDIKRNTDPDSIMRKLFSMTSLSDSFSCNFNILINSAPKVMGIKEILDEWITFRMECIRRIAKFDMVKKREKYHLLLGLAKVSLDIDKAILIIRETREAKQVIPNLMNSFSIDEAQAEYIAEIKLRNLNREHLITRINEMDNLKAEIDKLQDLIQNENLISDVICSQLKETSLKYGKPRMTDIIYEEELLPIKNDTFIEDYGIKLFLTEQNYFKKISLASLRSFSDQTLKDDDTIIQELTTTNKSDILLFSDKFNVYKTKAYELNDSKASSLGDYLSNILSLENDEKIIYIAATQDYNGHMIFAFENGKFAQIPLSSYQTKVNRKKLINAYSDRSKLIFISHDLEHKDYIVVRDSNKAGLFNTELIPVKASKNSIGVEVCTLRKKNIVSDILTIDQFSVDDPEYYRMKKLPFTGKFL